MTPILLDMQAFGPYLHQTKIDFTELGTDSLFLITGATGGGKTSILDAMSFALYCRATGGRRSWEEMRCDSASDDVSTFVEFQFQLGGEVYRFVRSRRVHFVRGSGRREFREEHYCKILQWDPDFQRDMWRELESGSESQVRRYAEKLLGLTAEQFSQVIVLPQGDFLRLLRASSREKAEMLRTLFSMTEWVKIQNALGEQSKALEKQLSEADAARDAVLRQEGEETLSGLREKALRLEEEEKALEEQAKTAGETLQKAEQTLAARRELTRVRLTARQERENLSRWEEEGKKAEAALAEQKAAMEEVPHLREESRKEAARAARLEEELQQAQTLAQVSDRLRETEKALQDARAGVEQSQKARQEIVGRLETGEAFMKEVLAAVEKLPALREREANLARGEQAYQEWDAAREKARRQEKEVDTQKAACARLAVTARSLTESLSRQEALFRADRAAFLAAGLEEGEPCPVCGSRNHPAPACPGEGAMEKGELEELRRQENQARQAVSAGEGKLRALETQWEQAKGEAAQRETQAAALRPSGGAGPEAAEPRQRAGRSAGHSRQAGRCPRSGWTLCSRSWNLPEGRGKRHWAVKRASPPGWKSSRPVKRSFCPGGRERLPSRTPCAGNGSRLRPVPGLLRKRRTPWKKTGLPCKAGQPGPERPGKRPVSAGNRPKRIAVSGKLPGRGKSLRRKRFPSSIRRPRPGWTA